MVILTRSKPPKEVILRQAALLTLRDLAELISLAAFVAMIGLAAHACGA